MPLPERLLLVSKEELETAFSLFVSMLLSLFYPKKRGLITHLGNSGIDQSSHLSFIIFLCHLWQSIFNFFTLK